MSTDYKPRKKRVQKKLRPPYLWLLAGLTIGLFVAFLIYLDKQPATQTSFHDAVNSELKKLSHKKSKSHKPLPIASAITGKKEPKYNFYTLLQDMEVLIPKSETTPPKVLEKTVKHPPKPASYILQIASFQKLSEAEKLKAKLAFLGIEANIQHVTINRNQWHRVRTGPYHDIRILHRNQKTLQQHHINSLLMELKQ